MLKNKIARAGAGVALALGLVVAGAAAPASAALPAAKASAVVVKAWPKTTSNPSPARGAAVGVAYHNPNLNTLVSTPKCPSKQAVQGKFQRWGMVAGGYRPLTGTGNIVYYLKCV